MRNCCWGAKADNNIRERRGRECGGKAGNPTSYDIHHTLAYKTRQRGIIQGKGGPSGVRRRKAECCSG